MCANLSLFTLPHEILTRIFALLEGRHIARCSAVCSYFKDIVGCSAVLQYFIKLDMFGYLDVSGSVDVPAISATRLSQLGRHIDAWNKLDWMESHIRVPFQYEDFGILCQGIIAMFNLKSVCCIQLPHLMRGIQFRTWTLGDFSFPIYQIEIDPSNNLLVVMSRILVRVSLSISSRFPIKARIQELQVTFFSRPL
ncbi:hypothetical protein BS47DRAFT_1139583 [Hydnum rufescens UP504]|uniref:F-box domain-containing protein n=1 Tax=Hydnum rufescens UP504 TaxID=1448309 RepID=A0A9P6ATN2_9AGAM|nr:hypothetical protein BS47DRAFT_1139583 [Hydnum rufescens UP504]